MREHARFTHMQKKDINNIMQLIRMYKILSPHAYRRLHSYILSLEKENRRMSKNEESLASEEVIYLN
ncbi:MAG: hypothetical protein JW904_09230 [Spirochaetales bacterium]|nr:hypothetical protein [Spirochaetales bacterium]